MRLASFVFASLIATLSHAQTGAPSTASPTSAPTAAVVFSDSPSSFPTITIESDAPSSAPTFAAAEDRPCGDQEVVFRECLNTTLSLADAEKCDDCVAASFPAPNNACTLFQSSVCTALARDCDCGECSADIESYIDCALEEAGRDNCALGCKYDTCDAFQFQFTSCMQGAGFTDDGISACVDCSRNALSNGGPVESCDEATGRLCPAIVSDCGCGSCRAELELYLGCDTVGKEIPSECTLDCGLASGANDRTDDVAPQDASGAQIVSAAVSFAVVALTVLL